MKRTALFVVLSIGFQTGFAGITQAIQRKHKPWLMAGSHDVQEATVQPESQEADISTTNGKDPGVRVAHRALEYKGTRYRYGGTNKRGMDCSGLVARVWADLKLKKIPRASS